MNPISAEALAAARAQLDAAEEKRENILLAHIANGVKIEDRTVRIDESVTIAPGAAILAGTILRGNTVIGPGCVIGPNSLIEDSIIDEGTTVNASQVYGSHLGPGQGGRRCLHRRRQHHHQRCACAGAGHRPGPPDQSGGLGRAQDGSLHRQKEKAGGRAEQITPVFRLQTAAQPLLYGGFCLRAHLFRL